MLRVNYQNTREILDFAFRFLTRGVPIDDLRSLEMDPEAIVPPEAASRTGPSPVVLTCADGEEEARQVASQVDRLLVGGVDPTNIAVLYGSQKVRIVSTTRSVIATSLTST